MDVIFDWNLGNMIYNGLLTLRLYGFPFAKNQVASASVFGLEARGMSEAVRTSGGRRASSGGHGGHACRQQSASKQERE